MRKKVTYTGILLLLMLSFQLLMLPASAASKNLCKNSGFETDASHWTAQGNVAIVRSTEKARSGKASLKVSMSGAWGTAAYSYNFQKNTTYTISMWVSLAEDTEADSVRCFLITDTSAYGTAEPKWTYVAQGNYAYKDSWTKLEFSWTYTGENKTGGMTFYPRFDNGEKPYNYYIDDVTITSLAAINYRETEWADGELVTNKGFDDDTEGWVTEHASISRTTDVVYDNSLASGLVNLQAASGYAGYKIPVKAGSSYRLSTMLRTFGEVKALRYGIVNSRGQKQFLHREFEVGGRWQEISDTYIASADGTVTVFIGCNTPTAYYLDDFSAVERAGETLVSEAEAVCSDLTVRINGITAALSPKPYLVGSKVIAPIRELSEALGATCDYHDGTVELKKGINRIVITEQSYLAQVNGVVRPMEYMASIINGKFMCDAEFLANSLSYKTAFDPELNLLTASNRETGLSYSAKKLSQDKTLTVGFLRASNPERAGQVNAYTVPMQTAITEWFENRFNDCTIRLIDKNVSGTGATLGAFRIDEDMADADLILIDMAHNDLKTPEAEIKAYAEGMVRNILQHNEQADIVFLYSLNSEVEACYRQGMMPEAFTAYDKVAAYYNIPVLNIGKAFYDTYTAEGKTLASYTDYNQNPNTFGMRILSSAVIAFLDNGLNCAANYQPVNLPRAMAETNINGALLSVTAAKTDDNWTLVEKTFPGTSRTQYLSSNVPGAQLTLEFSGEVIGLYAQSSPECGDILWSVDGSAFQSVSLFDEYSYRFEHAKAVILTDTLEDTKHTLTLKVSDTKNKDSIDHFVRFGAFLINQQEGIAQ